MTSRDLFVDHPDLYAELFGTKPLSECTADELASGLLTEVVRLRGLVEDIASDNSPHDAQRMAERECEGWVHG